MPYARIIPAVVLGLLIPLFSQAQAPAPAPVPEGPTMAENQLDAATIKVRLMKQIAASIDQKVDMLNQSFKLEGNYYKDFTKDYLVRLQLKLVGLGDTDSTMLQVSDGKILWDFQRVLKVQIYRKREILPILKKLEDPNLDIFLKSLVFSQIGFGGPEAMMTGLRKAVKFDQVAPGTLDGVDVWILSGTWIERSKLLGLNDRPLAPTAPLPPYVPSNIRIYIGKENGWPYKIVMVGNAQSPSLEDTRPIDPVSGRPVGVKKAPPKVDPSQITLVYKQLPTSEINPSLFVFNTPTDVPASSVKDETQEFLDQLDLLIQREINFKKAEAAKAADAPLLKTAPIEIPKDPAAGGVDSFPKADSPLPK